MFLKKITQVFEENANQEYAAKMSAYMKNRFHFYGIKAPKRKELQKPIFDSLKEKSLNEIINLVEELYNEPKRELHYLAIELLDKRKRLLRDIHLDFAEKLILKNSWWDTVDYLATHVFYPISLTMNQAELKDYILRLSVHDNMWLNRVGIIFQLPLKAKTNVELLELSIIPHIQSKEFFHQKAIGWALRQYSKSNPDYVIDFLGKYDLPKLSIREASKYL